MSELPQTIRLATRTSPLALAQAELTREHLQSKLPEAIIELVEITTRGDANTQWSLQKQGGTGLFTVEVEQAVREGRADIAVHSAKDLPSKDAEGMAVAGYLPRADVRDVIVVREGVDKPAFIATSSPRRRVQAQRRYPTAVWSEIRGNVHTRLRKIAEGKLDAEATFLAAAGLARLGIKSFEGVNFSFFNVEDMVPAGGQGAVALQVRDKDARKYAPLFCAQTAHAVNIERTVLARLGVGCHTAFGVHFNKGQLYLFEEGMEAPLVLPFEHTDSLDIRSAVDEIIKTHKLKG